MYSWSHNSCSILIFFYYFFLFLFFFKSPNSIVCTVRECKVCVAVPSPVAGVTVYSWHLWNRGSAPEPLQCRYSDRLHPELNCTPASPPSARSSANTHDVYTVRYAYTLVTMCIYFFIVISDYMRLNVVHHSVKLAQISAISQHLNFIYSSLILAQINCIYATCSPVHETF